MNRVQNASVKMLLDILNLLVFRTNCPAFWPLKVVFATFVQVCLLSLHETTCQTRKKCFFHFKSSFRSRENQILKFYTSKFHEVIKCLSIKQEIDFTE